MRIDGLWFECEDGVRRPIVRAEALASDGNWQPANFLVDPGADNTVFSADICAALGHLPQRTDARLFGIGGAANAALVEVEFRLRQADQTPVTFRGQFLAAVDSSTLDTSILGRDILNLFAVIIDRPQEVVCLLSQRHRYVVVEQ